jgi:hypothetical protein
MYADYENRYETALSIYTNFMKDQAFGNKVRVRIDHTFYHITFRISISWVLICWFSIGA